MDESRYAIEHPLAGNSLLCLQELSLSICIADLARKSQNDFRNALLSRLRSWGTSRLRHLDGTPLSFPKFRSLHEDSSLAET